MEVEKAIGRLKLFGIPAGDGDEVAEVRELLARFISSDSLDLSELQTARDIVQRTHSVDPWAYVALAVMFIALRAGNAFLNPEKGVELLKRAGHVDSESDESNRRFADSVSAIWTRARTALPGLRGDVVVKADGKYFFAKLQNAVRCVSQSIAGLVAGNRQWPPLSDAEHAAATKFQGIDLGAEQAAAVRKVAERSFVVVTGGPGTGKTTIVCAFLRALLARGDVEAADIALVAPTGRAAQRMGEALRAQCEKALAEEGKDEGPIIQKIKALKGTTIHLLLGGYPPNWVHTAENRLPQKLVVVDESSMVDVNLMQSLLAALRDDCRLVLLGDKDQLPSVDTGAVLGDLVGTPEHDPDYVVRLTESHRFTGELAAAATAINLGVFTTTEIEGKVVRGVSETVWLLPRHGEHWMASLSNQNTKNHCLRYSLAADVKPKDGQALIAEWAEKYGLLNGGELVRLAEAFPIDDPALVNGEKSDCSTDLFTKLDLSRILTVVRKGPYGVKGVNDLLLKKRYGGRMPVNPFGKVGVPVLITRNMRERDLYNGDIGVTVMGPNGMVALFPRGEKVVSCPIGLLPDHDVAYAITVHKSQGSEFENVLIVLPDNMAHPLLNRQIVYTGITRAKTRSVVLGSEAALRAAIRNTVDRDTGIEIG